MLFADPPPSTYHLWLLLAFLAGYALSYLLHVYVVRCYKEHRARDCFWQVFAQFAMVPGIVCASDLLGTKLLREFRVAMELLEKRIETRRAAREGAHE